MGNFRDLYESVKQNDKPIQKENLSEDLNTDDPGWQKDVNLQGIDEQQSILKNYTDQLIEKNNIDGAQAVASASFLVAGDAYQAALHTFLEIAQNKELSDKEKRILEQSLKRMEQGLRNLSDDIDEVKNATGA